MATRPQTAISKKTDPTMGLPPLNHHAASIDVGSAEHWVAVPPGSDPSPYGALVALLRTRIV